MRQIHLFSTRHKLNRPNPPTHETKVERDCVPLIDMFEPKQTRLTSDLSPRNALSARAGNL
jgi:hypothetical protein